MKQFRNTLYILLTVILASSCEQKIEVDSPETVNTIVVEGVVSTETDSSYVRLTRTLSFFDNTSPIPEVVDAKVMVNDIEFIHTSGGVYKPASPYIGTTGTTYNLKIQHEGKEYTSSSTLHKGVPLDTAFAVFKEAESFIEEGYSVRYRALDNRPRTQYTYFRFGFNNQNDTEGKDSIFGFRVLFDNADFPTDAPYYFELPFLRLKEGDTCIMVFRTVDENVFRFLSALGNRGGNSFFGTPPANLPTNIRGGALGIFAAYDVMRYRVTINP
jgi:hypothetical protein